MPNGIAFVFYIKLEWPQLSSASCHACSDTAGPTLSWWDQQLLLPYFFQHAVHCTAQTHCASVKVAIVLACCIWQQRRSRWAACQALSRMKSALKLTISCFCWGFMPTKSCVAPTQDYRASFYRHQFTGIKGKATTNYDKVSHQIIPSKFCMTPRQSWRRHWKLKERQCIIETSHHNFKLSNFKTHWA